MAQKAGQVMREEKLLGLRADLQVGGEGFRKFLQIFPEFFWNFLQFFWKISTIFWKSSTIFWKISTIFWKISTIFCNFFQPLRFPYDFSENSCPQSVTVQPGSRHYCKFTSKFTSKFTPILIKILQSTKFEGSHFHNLLQLFSHFKNLLRLPKTLLLAAVFSRPQLRRAKGTNGRPSPCDGGGMWAIRGIISRITSLIVSRLTSQRPGRKPTKNRGKTEAPFASPLPQVPLPHSTNFQILISQIISILVSRPTPLLIFLLPHFFRKKFQILISILTSIPIIQLTIKLTIRLTSPFSFRAIPPLAHRARC